MTVVVVMITVNFFVLSLMLCVYVCFVVVICEFGWLWMFGCGWIIVDTRRVDEETKRHRIQIVHADKL